MPNTIASTDVGGTGLSTVGTNGQVLTSNGTTLSWATPSASTLTGTLGVANGGTGLTSLTAGYIPYGNGTGAFGSSANLQYSSTSPLSIISTNPGGSTGTLRIADYSTNNSSGYIQFVNNSGSSQYAALGGISGGGLLFDNQAGEVMRFNSSGSLLIGTTTGVTNKSLVTYNSAQFGYAAAGTDASSFNGRSWAMNRDCDSGTIYNTGGFAYQFQHTPSTTAASDSVNLQVYNTAGSQVTTTALTFNGQGYVKFPGTVIQAQWTDMGSGNAQGTNSTPQSTGFTTTFTPKFSNSKILHICTLGMYFICDGRFFIGRGGTYVSPSLGDSPRTAYDWYNDMEPTTVTWMDSPGTTSTITYNWWACAAGCGNTWAIGSSNDFESSWTILEIAV